MALIGSSIDPSLFVNDYSGFAKAGAIQGQATAQMGKDIGDAATTGMEMFKEIKAKEGETKAFGKSMKAMAELFPDQADIYNRLEMDVLDPNASLIERVSRMNQTRETLNMINQQKVMGMNQAYKNYQMSGASGGGAAGAAGAAEAAALKAYNDAGGR
jgi:hypothetical protein